MTQAGSFSEYKEIYNFLSTPEGVRSLSQVDETTKADLLRTLNSFLNVYPQAAKRDASIGSMSLSAIYKGSLQTVIDIITDVGNTISEKDALSAAQFRRRLFESVTRSDRAFYVGIWLVLIALIVYFVDIAS
jgi:hypothetical protein